MTHTARDGWKWAPVEATGAMLRECCVRNLDNPSAASLVAGREAAKQLMLEGRSFKSATVDEMSYVIATMAEGYRAMLSAAPSPPSEVTREEIARVAAATIKKFSASPLTASPEFWERLVGAILEEYASLFHQRGEKG